MAAATVDVVVVGAGAAGMLCAATAARRGRRTVLLEKGQRPGLKILISGGGRCNVTTTRSGNDLELQYGRRRGRFLRHALHVLPPSAVRELFEALSVPLVEEDLEKLFPRTQKASSILQALLGHVRAAGAALHAGVPVTALTRVDDHFAVTAGTAVYRARAVVLATGGRSYPKTGATGDGYALAAQFGHTIQRTVPALAPLAVEAAWVRELAGIVLHDVELAFVDPAGRLHTQRRRPILFTHKGLSGPAPMDLSGDVEEHGGGTVRFDFAPDQAAAELADAWLLAARTQGRRSVDSLLPAQLPERVRNALVALADCSGSTLANLSREARTRLLLVTKDLRVPVTRSLGFDHAEVTRGGVDLGEVDARTMQSKLRPGLFVCGELLDVDGPIGGFNFQAAFATGHLAGLSV